MSFRSNKVVASVLAISVATGIVALTAIASSQAASIQPAYDLVTHIPQSALPANANVAISTKNDATVISNSRLETLDDYGWWAINSIPAGAGSICFSATSLTKSSTCVDPAQTKQVWLDANGVPYLSRLAATKNIKVHLSTSNKTGRFGVLTIGDTSQTQPFIKVGTTDFVATFQVPENTKTYTIKTQYTKSKKLYDDTSPIEGDASLESEIYLSNGVAEIYDSVAARSNLVLIHYHRDDNVYKSWGLHTWYSDSFGGAFTPTTWAKPKSPISSKPDAWGITWSVPLASFSTKLPYIIHKGDIKDPIFGDQYVDLETYGNEIWIESGKVTPDGDFRISYPQLATSPLSSDQLSTEDASVLVGSSPRSSFASDSIYFVMTDRYNNGNTANDTGGVNSYSRNATGYDPTDYSWSHGGDLAGLSDGCDKNDGTGKGLPRIKNMGFSAIWIAPPFKQNFIQGGSASYHGYWINDFTTIDPHWGTNAEFKSFVDCAHRLGIKVVVDIVMNHTGDVIGYRDGNYSFHNSPNTTAYIPSWGSTIKSPGWLNDLANYHNQGSVSDWGQQYQYQNGDFYGLDDIKTENDVVIQGFADVYSKWVNDFGVDGFRIDTAKHVDDKYFSKWWPKMLDQTASTLTAKNQKLFAFGEYYDSNTFNLSNYMRKYGLPSVLDFAFQNKALNFASGGIASNLSEVFDNDNNFITPTKSPYDLVTFLGNHDMGRVAMLLNQTGTTRASSDLLAHDIMFLTRGIPSVYYGDEVGMIGSGGDKAARQDMFATATSQWKYEDRVWGNPIGSGSSFSVTTPLSLRITALNALRKANPALANGSQTTRVSDNNALVVSRFDATSRTEYLVAFNSGNANRSVTVSTSTPSSSWQGLLGGSTVTSNASGVVTLTIPARGTLVYKAANPLPVANTEASVILNLNLNTGSQTVALSAGVNNSDLGSVTFVVKKNSGPWQVLGTDDSRSYGMTWDYQPFVGDGLPSGTKLAFAAINKSSSGTISISAVKALTIP